MPSNKNAPLIFTYRMDESDGGWPILQIANNGTIDSTVTFYNFADLDREAFEKYINRIPPSSPFRDLLSKDPAHCHLHDSLYSYMDTNQHYGHYHFHLPGTRVNVELFRKILSSVALGARRASLDSRLVNKYLSADAQKRAVSQYQDFLSTTPSYSFTADSPHHPLSYYLDTSCPGRAKLPGGGYRNFTGAALWIKDNVHIHPPVPARSVATYLRLSAGYPSQTSVAATVVLGVLLIMLLCRFVSRAMNPPAQPAPRHHPHST